MAGQVLISADALWNKAQSTPQFKQQIKEMKKTALADVDKLANELISMIKANLPESIASTGATLSVVSKDIDDNGNAMVIIDFDKGALFRESLEWVDRDGTPNGKSSGGVQNIVALFNNGYGPISRPMFGAWNTHGGVIVDATPTRPALHFMQDAVRMFNTKYGARYSVTATVGSEYN